MSKFSDKPLLPHVTVIGPAARMEGFRVRRWVAGAGWALTAWFDSEGEALAYADREHREGYPLVVESITEVASNLGGEWRSGSG